MAKAAYPTIGIAALVMFGIVYLIGCLRFTKIDRTLNTNLPISDVTVIGRDYSLRIILTILEIN